MIFSNKLFHFFYKILNAQSEQCSNSTLLWNFCHLFPVLFYDWNTVLMKVFDFLGFFLGFIFWKVASLFNGWDCFSVGMASFLSGGVHRGAMLLIGEVFRKNLRMGGAPIPHAPLLWKTLILVNNILSCW